jgi:hypothetical protein
MLTNRPCRPAGVNMSEHRNAVGLEVVDPSFPRYYQLWRRFRPFVSRQGASPDLAFPQKRC